MLLSKIPRKDHDSPVLSRRLVEHRHESGSFRSPSLAPRLTFPEVPEFPAQDVQIRTTASGTKLCIGKGSYGAVYLATYLPTKRTITIKEQPTASASYSSVSTEASIQHYLQPTGRVPAIFGISEETEIPGMTRIYMEYIAKSCTLTRLLQKSHGSGSKRAIVELARDICIAVNDIHIQGILHNDIKRDNILIQQSSQTKQYRATFIDFGLASELDGVTMDLTPDKQPIFPHYAPELFYGAHSSIKSDIFSLGYVISLVNEKVGSPFLDKIGKICRLRNPARRPNMDLILKGIDAVLISEVLT